MPGVDEGGCLLLGEVLLELFHFSSLRVVVAGALLQRCSSRVVCGLSWDFVWRLELLEKWSFFWAATCMVFPYVFLISVSLVLKSISISPGSSIVAAQRPVDLAGDWLEKRILQLRFSRSVPVQAGGLCKSA